MSQNQINLKGVSTIVWVRAVMSIIAALNVALVMLGIRVIPFTESDVSVLINGGVMAVTIATWAWGWWKNNSMTLFAQKADVILVEGPPVEPVAATELPRIELYEPPAPQQSDNGLHDADAFMSTDELDEVMGEFNDAE